MNLRSAFPARPSMNRSLERFGLILLLTVTSLVSSRLPAWSAERHDVVYTESNSPTGNSVLAFQNDGTGNLTFLSSTPAGGLGVFDKTFALGPFDSDQNLTINPERTFLFAVNSGSNSIAVFRIHPDGSLEAVTGSPFASGGSDPVSVGVKDSFLAVVNKDQDPAQNQNVVLPNYTTFQIWPNGTLTPIKNSTVSVAYGSSPSQALISSRGSFVFGADFQGGLLQSLRLDEEGRLHQNPPTAVPNSAFAGSGAPHLPLGLRTHTTLPILYVDVVPISKVAVFRYDENGRLTFVRAVADSGAAPCWAIVNHSGTRLYAINTGDNSVSVFDLTNPWDPAEIQHFVMDDTTGAPFSTVIDDSDQFIYVSSELVSASATPAANAIHTLKVDANGTLSEPFAPAILPVSGTTRTQGIAVY